MTFEVQEHVDAIERQGFSIAPRLVEESFCDEIIAEIERLESRGAPSLRANEFTGFKTLRYFDLLKLRNALGELPLCEAGVPVRELPPDCVEAVATPRELFAKLDDWGYPSIVIPHGNAWGNTTPARVEWEKQLAAGQHDPARQTLIEVYSGHGSSEVYRPWRHVELVDGVARCARPSEGFVPEYAPSAFVRGFLQLPAEFTPAR